MSEEVMRIIAARKERQLNEQARLEQIQVNSPEVRIGIAVQDFLDSIDTEQELEYVKDNVFGGKGLISFYNRVEEAQVVGSFSYDMWSGPKAGSSFTHRRFLSGYLYTGSMRLSSSGSFRYPENSIFVGFFGSGYEPRLPSHFIVSSETPLLFQYGGFRNDFEHEVEKHGVELDYAGRAGSIEQLETLLDFISPSNTGLVEMARGNFLERLGKIVG